MKRGVSILFGLILACSTLFASSGKFVLVIDPGHGGRDPGALRGSIKEKDINLAVAKVFGDLVKQNMSDVEIIYTRSTDVFVSLQGRAIKANKAKANLFVSIHTNSTAAKSTTATGADTYILGLNRSAENMEVAKRENSVIKLEDDYTTKYEGFDPDSPESYIIFEFMTNHHMDQSFQAASYIQNDFKTKARRVDRGVKQGGLLVLRESAMPSILIELGFINNPTEAKYLSTSAGQKTMGTSIYTGFKKYKEEFDKRSGMATVDRNSTTNSKGIAPQETRISTTSAKEQNAGKVEYRIQFMYSPTKLSENSSKFKGLKNVGFYQDKGYKYTVGATTDYKEIEKLYKEVKKKFKDAFIIRMKDGKRL